MPFDGAQKKQNKIAERAILVQKFGGTSVGSLERIEKSAQIVLDKWEMGSSPVVVVSAMSGETNRLESMAREITHHENAAMDLVLSAGEQVSVGLMSLMLDKLARKRGLIEQAESIASPYLSHQLPIGTYSCDHADAEINYINTAEIYANAGLGKITVLPGYQAFNGQKVLTLGRGGSDTSAVAIAGLLKADLCEIYTDVDGIYSADPRVCQDALKYNLITTEEMQILSRNGAKVMHHKAISAAHQYKVPVMVKSSFEPKKQGTLIVHPCMAPDVSDVQQEQTNGTHIYGVTSLKDVMAIEIPDREGLEEKLKSELNLLSLTRQGQRLQIIVDNKYWDNFAEVLKKENLSVDRPQSLYGKINILGENLSSSDGLDHKLSQALDGASRQIKGIHKNGEMVTILVNRDALREVTQKVHQSFRQELKPKLNEIDQEIILQTKSINKVSAS